MPQALTLDQVLGELESLNTYIVHQQAAKRDVNACLARKAANIETLLKRLGNLSMQNVNTLMQAVTEGPWTDDQKATLGAAIDEAYESNGALEGSKRREMQTCLHF